MKYITSGDPREHPNCRCVLSKPPTPADLTPSQRRFWEDGCKMAAKLLLSQYGRDKRLAIPTEEEWVGLNLLERDDEI